MHLSFRFNAANITNPGICDRQSIRFWVDTTYNGINVGFQMVYQGIINIIHYNFWEDFALNLIWLSFTAPRTKVGLMPWGDIQTSVDEGNLDITGCICSSCIVVRMTDILLVWSVTNNYSFIHPFSVIIYCDQKG